MKRTEDETYNFVLTVIATYAITIYTLAFAIKYSYFTYWA